MLMAAASGVAIVLAGLLVSNIEAVAVRWFAFIVLEVPLLLIALPLDSVELPQWLTIILWATTALLLWSGAAFIALSLLRLPRDPIESR